MGAGLAGRSAGAGGAGAGAGAEAEAVAEADAGNGAGDDDSQCVVRIRFVGGGFLRHMLRRLVGAALAVARGKLPVTYIRDALAEADARLLAPRPAGAVMAVPASDGAAHDYAVAHGRGLWLERTILPDRFWDRSSFTTNTLVAYRAQHGLDDADLFVSGAGKGESDDEG